MNKKNICELSLFWRYLFFTYDTYCSISISRVGGTIAICNLAQGIWEQVSERLQQRVGFYGMAMVNILVNPGVSELLAYFCNLHNMHLHA